jgi:hypothetical protein
MMRCRAEAACTITYNAASLIVPGAANIVTSAGDTWWVRADQDGVETLFGYERNVAP